MKRTEYKGSKEQLKAGKEQEKRLEAALEVEKRELAEKLTVMKQEEEMRRTTWFNKASSTSEQAEKEFLDKRRKENEATSEAQKHERLEEMKRKLGTGSKSKPATGSSASST